MTISFKKVIDFFSNCEIARYLVIFLYIIYVNSILKIFLE